MKVQSLPAVGLAVGLQLVPVCRVAWVRSVATPPGFAIVFRWLACAVTLLGSYHTVSGASTAIAGVANTNPRGPVTTVATGKVGQPFSYRIVVTNPGVTAQNFYDAVPLPPGLTIDKSLGANGYITGTPAAAGSFPVTVSAGNQNSATIVQLAILIVIVGSSPLPHITDPPTDQIALAGADVTLSVTASGSGLAYQWRFNGVNLVHANTPALTISKVTTAQSGLYSVAVSNSGGVVVSGEAQLLVVPPPGPALALGFRLVSVSANQLALSFTAESGYGHFVEYCDSLGGTNWVTLTNLPPAFTNTAVSLDLTAVDAPQRFYRVRVDGP